MRCSASRPVSDAEEFILGAGPTGIGIALNSGRTIFEAADHPGGICHSYYVDRQGTRIKPGGVDKRDAYRFEHGGGHWMFGLTADSIRLIESFDTLEFFERRAAVFFPSRSLFVPYPIQAHLEDLPPAMTHAGMVARPVWPSVVRAIFLPLPRALHVWALSPIDGTRSGQVSAGKAWLCECARRLQCQVCLSETRARSSF